MVTYIHPSKLDNLDKIYMTINPKHILSGHSAKAGKHETIKLQER